MNWIYWLILVVLLILVYFVMVFPARRTESNKGQYLRKKDYLKCPYFNYTNLSYDEYRERKGVRFEAETFNTLSEKLDGHVMTNILIQKPNSLNEYMEIDILYVGLTGVYCIELKDYNCVVYGNENDSNWIADYGEKHHYFMNPIRQNQPKVECVKEIVNSDVENCVVFSSTNEFNSNMDNVSFLSDLIRKIQESNKILDEEEIRDIRARIINSNNYSKIDYHIRRVRLLRDK